jgi:hypothetical protein
VYIDIGEIEIDYVSCLFCWTRSSLSSFDVFTKVDSQYE